MGMVYEAQDVERDVRVALKTVLHHDPDALARFKHEFRALQDIHHPNLVALGELVADGGEVFFTMELVEGVDLLTWVRGEPKELEATTSKTVVEARRVAEPTLLDPPASGVLDRPTVPAARRSSDATSIRRSTRLACATRSGRSRWGCRRSTTRARSTAT